MEIEPQTQEKTGFFARGCDLIKGLFGKMMAKALEVAKKIKKVGLDDPRRIVHSLKVGSAITLVSLFYYVRPLYNGFGSSSMWAIFTVVVVFEFSIGATISKSMNRGFATLLAGALGVGAHQLASLFGQKGEPFILGVLVFLLVATSTFIRFFPHIKAKYDYGVLIFILTFSLVSVSGYRVDTIFELAHQRLSTIMLGGAICLVVAIFVRPVWAGEDLHNLVASNLEKLASFLEGFGGEYFKVCGDIHEDCGIVPKEDSKSLLQGYKSVLNTKATEESLANFAWWEPGHGSFRFRHPWKLYLKIGSLSRNCAYHFEALSAFKSSNIRAPTELRSEIQDSCMKMSSESGKALKELAAAMKTSTHGSSANVHIGNSRKAVEELKTAMKAFSRSETTDLLENIVPAMAVASILCDIVKCVEEIFELVHELSQQQQQAHYFKPENGPEKPQLLHRGSVKVKPISNGNCDGDDGHVTVTVYGISLELPENGCLDPESKANQRVEV